MILVRGGVGISLVPRSANLTHVPNVRLLDTGLDEAKWKISLPCELLSAGEMRPTHSSDRFG